MKKESASDVILQYLTINGPKTSAELKREMKYTTTCVNNALMRLKNNGTIGKRGITWGVSYKHEPRRAMKSAVLDFIDQGNRTLADMANELNTTPEVVSSEISRICKLTGLKVKKVYVFE